MMQVLTGSGPGGTGATVLARVAGNDGTPITQATVSTIAYTVTDLAAGQVVASGTFTVSSTVFNALQTNDPRWTVDGTGFNFAGQVPASAFPVQTPAPLPGFGLLPPVRRWQIDVAFTPVSGEPFRLTGYYTTSPAFG